MLISILGFLSYCFYVLGYCFPSSSHEEKVVDEAERVILVGVKLLCSQFSNQCYGAMAIEKIDGWQCCYIAKQ